jgi:hypothetical protein
MVCRIFLHDLVEGRDKGLGEPEGESELGTSHKQLGEQALEEGGRALVLEHVGDDASASLLDLEVAVLDAGLDDVERSRDNEGGGGTGDGSNEVLGPGSAVVVLELVEVLLGGGGTTEESERTRSVTGGSPAPTSVETEALVGNDPHDTTATERLGVCLPLDLENVEREQDNLTNANKRTSGGVHDGLAIAGAEGLVEEGAVVLGQVVAHEGLTTVLVDALQDLVGGGVAETGEEGEVTGSDRLAGGVLEDDLVEVLHAIDLALVGHQTLGDGVDGVEDGELSDTGRALDVVSTCASDMIVLTWLHIPAPSTRAMVDSFWLFFADPTGDMVAM